MHTRKLIALVLLSVFSLNLVSSCGWRLRGALTLPASMERVFLEGESSSELRRTVSSILKGSAANLVADKVSASVVIVIANNKASKRVLSLTSAGVANEYELMYYLQYSVETNDGKPLLGQSEIAYQRTFRFDPNQILASQKEEDKLRNEMIVQATTQMLRRIATQLRQGKS